MRQADCEDAVMHSMKLSRDKKRESISHQGMGERKLKLTERSTSGGTVIHFSHIEYRIII